MYNFTSQPPEIERKPNDISDEMMNTINTILMLVVTPIISILGVVGNSFSLVILFKHGLHKTSNILLFVLALADLIFLIAYLSIPKIVYDLHGQRSFRFSKTISQIWFVFYLIIRPFDYGTSKVATSVPVFITIERLFAVFLPLRFPQIITTFRTWMAMGILAVVWFSYFIHSTFYLYLDFVYDPTFNMTVGKIRAHSSYYSKVNGAIAEAVMYIGNVIPPMFTFVGCVIIYIKVRIASHKRKKLTSSASARSTSQTTKTLLAVCFVYIFSCAYNPFQLIPQVMSPQIVNGKWTNWALVMDQVFNILYYMYCSFNFIVYVAMNRNFRATFKTLICRGSADGQTQDGKNSMANTSSVVMSQ